MLWQQPVAAPVSDRVALSALHVDDGYERLQCCTCCPLRLPFLATGMAVAAVPGCTGPLRSGCVSFAPTCRTQAQPFLPATSFQQFCHKRI